MSSPRKLEPVAWTIPAKSPSRSLLIPSPPRAGNGAARHPLSLFDERYPDVPIEPKSSNGVHGDEPGARPRSLSDPRWLMQPRGGGGSHPLGNGGNPSSSDDEAVRKMMALLSVDVDTLGGEEPLPALAKALSKHVQEFEKRGQLLKSALQGTTSEESAREDRERLGGRMLKEAAQAEARASKAERALAQVKAELEEARRMHRDEVAALQRHLAHSTRKLAASETKLRAAGTERLARSSMSPSVGGSPRLAVSPRPSSSTLDVLPQDLTEDRLRKFVVRVVRAVEVAPATGPITPAHLMTTLGEIERLVVLGRVAGKPINDSSNPRSLSPSADENLRLFCTLFGVEHAREVAPTMQHVYAELSNWHAAARILQGLLGLPSGTSPYDLAAAVESRLS